MMKYALFLGCLIPVKYPGFESATREVARELGIELVDMEFSCCPSPTVIKLVHYDSWLALAARNLCLAEEEGLNIVTMCNGCTNTLKEANLALKKEPLVRKRINDLLKSWRREFKGEIEVKHLLDVLCDDVGLEAIAKKVKKRLPFSIACHYGCHFHRPPRIMYPDRLSPSKSIVPTQMDDVLAAIGMNIVPYMRRFLCCGSALGTKVDLEAANEITREKLSHMAERDAQAISVACPSCFEQFDRAQVLLKSKHGREFGMPVFYISQLLGLAFDIDQEKLGFSEHRVKVEPLLNGQPDGG
jgi:heterodisulfide reductase subunit B